MKEMKVVMKYHFVCVLLGFSLNFERYRIRGNFRGMKLNRKQTGFLRLYFRRSQVHRGKVACYVPLQISNCCKLANFHGLNFCCICR